MAEKDLNQTAYVLGILSIIFGFISPLAGLATGIVGIFHARKKSEMTRKARILNIIGIVISAIMLVLVLVVSYMGTGSASSLITTP